MNPDTLYDDGFNDNWDEFDGLDPADPDNYDTTDEDEYGGVITMEDSSDLLRYDDVPEYDEYNDPDNY